MSGEVKVVLGVYLILPVSPLIWDPRIKKRDREGHGHSCFLVGSTCNSVFLVNEIFYLSRQISTRGRNITFNVQ